MSGSLGHPGAADAEIGIDERFRQLTALDRLLNDPDVPFLPDRVWTLAFAIARDGRAGWMPTVE